MFDATSTVLKVILVLFLLSGIPAAILGAWKLWQLRYIDNIIRYKGILMTAIAVDMIVSIIASSNDTPNLRHTTWFWSWYIPGQAIVTLALWALDACLFGLIPRGKILGPKD